MENTSLSGNRPSGFSMDRVQDRARHIVVKLPITHKTLIDWAGAQVVHEAEIMAKNGQVLQAEYVPPYIRGIVLWSNRELKPALRLLPDGTVENHCPCYANKERGVICAHSIALGLILVKRATDPLREARYQEEIRHASRMEKFQEADYIRRVPPDAPGAIPARLVVGLAHDWLQRRAPAQVPLLCSVEYFQEIHPIDEVAHNLPLSFAPQDESLLYVLEDIAGGPARSRQDVNFHDLLNVIRLHVGRTIQWEDHAPINVNETPMTTHLRMDLDRENGELIVLAHTELPFMRPGEFPVYTVAGKTGWVYGAGNLWPLANVLPLPYHSLYVEPVVIARSDAIQFLIHELPRLAEHVRVESDITLDLFTVEPATPQLILEIRGSPASLAATLYASYGDLELVAGKPDAREKFSLPDPKDLMRYAVRNPAAESRALAELSACGMIGQRGDELQGIVGNHQVLNFLASGLPALRRKGWKVRMEGKVAPYLDELESVSPVVHIQDAGQGVWYDVSFDFEDAKGQSLTSAEIQLALRKGQNYVQRNGRTLLLDADAIDSMQNVFSDCVTGESDRPGHFRVSSIHAGYIHSSLTALDGIDMEDSNRWRALATRYNRSAPLEPVSLPADLEQTLRSYQKDGIQWLRFLEAQGFCGVLADEMGLGKTIQALAWLRFPRQKPEAAGKPALVVCPTSLVENWAEEAARFAPSLRVLQVTGPERHSLWEQVARSDLVITSYSLLRRDQEHYAKLEFSAAILDEAQHIKNRVTQNALAAKRIRAHNRFVLTGTPIENGVGDLWSIMDFLMPGYLGTAEKFRQHYEIPIARGGEDAGQLQTRLRRKLHPFMLRRLKSEVAKDLPPKIEKVATCSLTADQMLVYKELLESSRRKLRNLVAAQGFNRCRMEILTTLMRLRQVCCHLKLLKLPGVEPAYPSSKLDLFFELLDEALDGGHRILVFSQFVSMLHILRTELEARGLTYCYLDGSTTERLKVVHTFNTQRDIPIFLISLKAGGAGLNLTGADMVIHFDPWWNPAVENQATDRAHRIGQKRTVYSIKLITKGTIEEKVLALQQKKRAVIEATIEAEDGMPQHMTWDDVEELLV